MLFFVIGEILILSTASILIYKSILDCRNDPDNIPTKIN